MDLQNTISLIDTKDKVIFWDLDGTLAPYRFDGQLELQDDATHSLYKAAIDKGVFTLRKPSKFMQDVVATCGSRKNVLISHYRIKEEIPAKDKWMDMHYPKIKDRVYVPLFDSKEGYILRYCNENKIPIKDVVFVDDVIELLRKAKNAGIESWHISSFLDWFIEK